MANDNIPVFVPAPTKDEAQNKNNQQLSEILKRIQEALKTKQDK